jgi:Cu2+-containing amine oxidase
MAAYIDHTRYADYDYSFIYSFMLDGSIGVEVMASGCESPSGYRARPPG